MPRRSGKIGETFTAAADEGRAALIIYTTAGHPNAEEGLRTLCALDDAGADIIELGIPFSDPLADGPTIQRSSFEAIQQGVDLAWSIDLLRRFREERDTPIVLFSYLNPVLDYGVDRFIADATEAGADGLILTDLPADVDPELEGVFERSPLDLVRLVAPTSSPDRVRRIASRSQGFVYYISRMGVTGARQELAEGLRDRLAALRAASALPVAVGFGISTPEQAAVAGALADGVVVGSAVVDVLSREGVDGASRLVAGLRGALGMSPAAST